MSGSEEKVEIVVNTYNDHKGSVTNVNEARDIHNNATYISYHNVLPKSEVRPIRFRYQLPVDDFIGREGELIFLKEKLCIENPRVMVVSGLGGIGKTQLVRKFIDLNKDFYRNIVWINSQRKESIEEEFKILAESALNISVKVDEREEKDFRCILGMIFDKLSSERTLLVFDNVDKIEALEIVLDIVAAAVKPHILITSRIQEFSDSVNFRRLEVFSSDEALDYISTKLSDQNESLADKMALADTLRNLPLALRQATGHIKYHRKRNRNYKIRSYITDFNKYREQTLGSDIFQKDIFNQYKGTTLTTWKITMNAISESEPHGELALRILHIMAYFDNVHILREIFFNLEGISNEPELKEREVISAVGLICNYSMVDDYEYRSVLSIHKLVQEVIQIQLEKERRSEISLRDGLQLISKMEEKEEIIVCLAHGISVYLSALRFRELVTEFDTYPSMILQNLDKSGNYIRALSFANEINEQFTTIIGVDHRSTTLLQFETGRSCSNLGKYSEALKIYEEVLEKQKIILDEDHPLTITTKHFIAHSYSELGRYFESLQMYEEVLGKRENILGPDHPSSVATKHNIANLYSKLGKYSESLQMYEEVLEKRKCILGEDHSSTLATKHNIANLYSKLGRYSESLQMYNTVLETRKNTLPEDHPSTIATKDNIANLYSKLGRYCDASQIYQEVVEKRKIILGEHHPRTIATKRNIANLYSKLGKYSESLQIYEEVLEKRIAIRGEDHPSTIATKDNIANLYSKLGRNSEALQMYEEVLEKRKNILGPDHPDSILIKHNIAHSYSKLGRDSDAMQMYEEVLEKTKIILGENHPNTILTKHSIANLYSKLGRNSEALQIYEEVLEKRKILFGEDHPRTLATKRNIANLCSKLGEDIQTNHLYSA